MKDKPEGWGEWTLDAVNKVLVHQMYEVDLERCRTSAEVLDWIMQVNGKAFDLDVAGLVRALDDVLGPQGTLCPMGSSRTISEADLEAYVRSAANRWPDRLSA